MAAIASSSPLPPSTFDSDVSVLISVVGGVVGIIGLYLSWASGRAERAAKRLDQLISIESDARSRGAFRSADHQHVAKHDKFLGALDEEIRLHQRFAFDAARRAGSGTSAADVAGWGLYGLFLIWSAIWFPSHTRSVGDTFRLVSGAVVLGGTMCLCRAIVLAVRRLHVWRARRATGIDDLYSATVRRRASARARRLLDLAALRRRRRRTLVRRNRRG